jgi:DNA-binding NtrC family response regulator
MEEKHQPIRLLLVDDEKGFVEVMAKRMGKRDIHVVTALNGTEGIQALRRNDFDVAVLDLKMEDMDGIEVLRIFKKMAPGMPVIMLTGHGSKVAAEEGIAQGACNYMTKPCSFEELFECILDVVQKER